MSAEKIRALRAALDKNKLVCGTFQLATDPMVTEILLGEDFDFVLVDAEHRALNPESIEGIVRAAQGLNKSALVRIRQLTRSDIQYALDAGAVGVLVPLVNDRADAELAVSFSRYPPMGTRGLNAGTRAAGWGASDSAGYTRAANRSTVVAVQIESRAALENLNEIASVKGVDMLFVGPFDLSLSLGLTGQLNHPDVRAAIRQIFNVGRKHGKWLGVLAPDPAFARWCLGLGVRFMAYRSDTRMLKAAAAASAAETTALRKRVP